MPRDVSSQMWQSLQLQKLVLEWIFFKSYHKFIEFNLFFIHLILFWIDELIHLYSIYLSSMNIEFHLWYENCRRHFQIYLQWKCLKFNYNFTDVCSLKYSILYLKRPLSVPSHYQYCLQIIDIHPRAISQNISKMWWQFLCTCQWSMSSLVSPVILGSQWVNPCLRSPMHEWAARAAKPEN